MLGCEEFVSLVRAVGADRVLFGTDSPWSDQKKSVCDISALPLEDDEKDMIFCSNARGLLGI